MRTYLFVQTAVYEDGNVVVSNPDIKVPQLVAIDGTEMAFTIMRSKGVHTARLYRVEPETGVLAHVQTWTRKEVEV
jgi:hypothetical protein